MNSWVNKKITVRKSGEKGVGSFANARIRKGEKLIVQGGKIMSYQALLNSAYRNLYNHAFQVSEGLLICPIDSTGEKLDGIFQVNHSCAPNCGLRGQIILVAMQVIEQGEEITYDYAMTDANQGEVTCDPMTCLCGSNNCRKTITGDDWKNKSIQNKYDGYFSTYIQSLIKQQV